jgi:hypothetical protein
LPLLLKKREQNFPGTNLRNIFSANGTFGKLGSRFAALDAQKCDKQAEPTRLVFNWL